MILPSGENSFYLDILVKDGCLGDFGEFVGHELVQVTREMFPLSDSGKEVASFQEIMHIFVTVMVVLLSIASLATLIIVGCRRAEVRSIGIWAATALGMMIGFIGTGAVPPQYFGIVERFSVFAAVGFNAVPGVALFKGFPSAESEELY